MDCIINGGMFLRSNGNLVCWDDVGCNHVLQAWDPGVDYGSDVFLGPVYNEIRESMRAGHKPFAACREGCLALNAEVPFDDSPRLARRLNYMQIESSFACQLACPNCYPGVKRSTVLPKTEGGHLQLEPHVVEKILEDFRRSSITVELLEFQGHGEPLINPRVWEMIATCRRLQPRANIKVVTNANFDFEPGMAASGVSEMVFSIDGVDQSSYVPYRVKGKFEKAYAFMKAFCHEVKAKQLEVRTIWKYVLFSHDDSEEQLVHLARLAAEAQVDEVQLIVTMMGDTSRRFFSAFLELQTEAARQPEVAAMVSKLRFSADAKDVHGAWRKGKSPLPEQLVQLRTPKVSLFSYLTLQTDLDHELDVAAGLLRAGNRNDAGDSVTAFAHRLWRLYDLRPEMLIAPHAALITRALAYVAHVPLHARYEILLKLDVFAPYLSRPTRPRTALEFWLHPCGQLALQDDGLFRSTGEDPQIILFAHDLRMPTGSVLFQLKAEVLSGSLAGPRLYVDDGSDFSEERSFLLGTELGDLSLRLELPSSVRRLRFDPGTAEGTFRIREITVTELAGAECATDNARSAIHATN
jgi:wyosine [tRNA(Phe)-imidazoG37] synthetase (radical SAM superfamily)